VVSPSVGKVFEMARPSGDVKGSSDGAASVLWFESGLGVPTLCLTAHLIAPQTPSGSATSQLGAFLYPCDLEVTGENAPLRPANKGIRATWVLFD